MHRNISTGGRRRPSRWGAGTALAVAVASTYGSSLWLHLLHRGDALGAGLPLWAEWLRDATLVAPAAFALVFAAMAATRRASAHLDAAVGERVAGLLSTGLAALGASAGMALTIPMATWLLPGQTSLGGGATGTGADAIATFPVALLIAATVLLLSAPSRGRRFLRVAGGRAALAAVMAASALGAAPLSGIAAAQSVPSDAESPCPEDAETKSFDISAIDVDIPLNRVGDHDPEGKMFAFTDEVGAIRADERKYAQERRSGQPVSVSIGLRDDLIQPLVIRANMGDCVVVNFTNQATGGAYGVHIDGLSYDIGSSGDAIGLNPSSAVPRGQSRTYRYYIPKEPTLEGSHYIHPGPGYRSVVSHGLFGALVVEPSGSTYLHPETREPLRSGWEAIIDAPPGACDDLEGKCDFREAVQLWHEVGNEQYRPRDRNDQHLPMREDLTGAYGPSRRAINYRSEPFYNRMLPQAYHDEKSHTYSSYTFGDPPTTIPRSYLGDPMKWRLMHVGTEMFHVFHLHGGGIRWRQNPAADPTFDYSDTGLDKDPPTKLSPSNRLDSQAIGPGESFNLEIEGGAGGVQQAAGDFLYHCHIAHHYFAGMWSFWRTYDTLQADLAPLPDRDNAQDRMPAAVNSAELIGKTIQDGTPDGITITAENLDEWIRPQLPPKGVPRSDQDAAVWNWKIDRSDPIAPVYLGEPEDSGPWPLPNGGSGQWPDISEEIPGHLGSQIMDRFVGNRPQILFNPDNGRPAYPLLRTHVGKRPPFSPNGHTGAPWLGERGGIDPAAGDVNPWAGRDDGICPEGAPERHFDLVSINKSAPVTREDSDREASVFTLAQDKQDVLAGRKPVEPLAIRANVGECVTGTYTTEMPESPHFTKSNLHIHHVQFDVQASDGVVSGFAYEQSIRPYKLEDPQLTADAPRGSTQLQVGLLPRTSSVVPNVGGVAGTAKFRPGEYIAVGEGTPGIEVAQIESISGNTLNLVSPLERDHLMNEWAGTEYVQFRWFPDVGLDNIFWHDHVDGIHGWGHGMVGQLIIEPPGSTYHDPVTGEEVDSGAIVDVHTTGTVFPGVVEGSFRELALWTIDDNPVAESTLNLRAEPWALRGPDPSTRLSSRVHGDPNTPLPRAYPGDPFVIRTINVGPAVDTLHIDGQRFWMEGRYLDDTGKVESSPMDTLHYGVSEKFSVALEGGAGGPNHEPGDYLYMNGIGRRFRQGAWGIIRVLNGRDTRLQPLPGHPAPTGVATKPLADPQRTPSEPGDPCPANSAARSFDVSAVDLPVAGVSGASLPRAAYVPSEMAADVEAGRKKVEPLVLHAAAGDCVTVHFKNERAASRASFHASELIRDIGSSGVNVGYNPEQTVAPGSTKDYRFYADTDKSGAAIVTDFGGRDTGADGLYGAIVVGPKGARFTDPVTGDPSDVGSPIDVRCDSVCTHDGKRHYRDFTLALFERDPIVGTDDFDYPTQATGPTTINYKTAGFTADGQNAFSSIGKGDPATPLLRAHAGDPIKVHAYVAPGSEAMHSFTLGGMSWQTDSYIHNGNEVSTQGVGPWETVEADVIGGAGGREHAVGDYFYGDLRRLYTQGGMWGLFRVLPRTACAIDALDRPSCPDLAPESDSGRSESDDLTNASAATFTGHGGPASTVHLSVDGLEMATGSVDSDGKYSVEADLSGLSDGAHSVTATSTDPAGVTTAPSGSLEITIDRSGPSSPEMPDLDAASDTGTSRSDNLTNDVTPTLTGSAEARAGVKLMLGDAEVATGRADASGTYSLEPASLDDGAKQVSVVAVDKAGNESAASAPLEVTIDTLAPSETPSVPDLDAASDRGRSDGDDITSARRATFTGTSPADAARIELLVNGAQKASGAATSGYSIDAALPEGKVMVAAAASDAAGNTGPASEALEVKVDRKAPALRALAITPDPFNSRTRRWARIASSVGAAARVTADVTRSGKLVRDLGAKHLSHRGAFTFRWDGRNDKGRRVRAHTYKVLVRATDVAGNVSRRAARVRVSFR